MGLTRKQAICLHRELWDWLYENPDKKKYDWPRWRHQKGRVKEAISDCFLCELIQSHHGCSQCPLDPEPSHDGCLGGLWDKFKDAKTPKTRKKYAALIRDLPERTDI